LELLNLPFCLQGEVLDDHFLHFFMIDERSLLLIFKGGQEGERTDDLTLHRQKRGWGLLQGIQELPEGPAGVRAEAEAGSAEVTASLCHLEIGFIKLVELLFEAGIIGLTDQGGVLRPNPRQPLEILDRHLFRGYGRKLRPDRHFGHRVENQRDGFRAILVRHTPHQSGSGQRLPLFHPDRAPRQMFHKIKKPWYEKCPA